jgi:hypothetical protein
MVLFSSGLGSAGETIARDELARLNDECKRRKAFYSLSWVAYPAPGSDGHVDPKSDAFMRFYIPTGSIAIGETGGDASYSSYVGFGDTNTPPKILTTIPNVLDFVTFLHLIKGERLSNGLKASDRFDQPVLRPEIIDGRAKFQVLIDSNTLTVAPAHVRKIYYRSKSEWTEAPTQELFYGTGSEWDRVNPVPYGHDPARKP